MAWTALDHEPVPCRDQRSSSEGSTVPTSTPFRPRHRSGDPAAATGGHALDAPDAPVGPGAPDAPVGPDGHTVPVGPVGRFSERIAAALTGRRSAWAVLAVSVVVLLAVMGGMRGAGPVAGMDALTETSESSRAAAIAATMEDSRYQPVFAVITRADGAALTEADAAAVETLRAD